jgi:2-polyprenyl-3-methyl-5-hydroxy-6-metoxy-1,4-benzoquinol methylase
MEKVDERISLNEWLPPWVRHQHVTRYEWLVDFIKGREVIEAACGTGYGSRIMIEGGALRVDSFDLSAEAISQARRENELPGLNFEIGDVTKLPVADRSYDVYVSLETIEHIVDDRAVLREAVRALKPGGVFICSTPNRALTNPGTTIDDHPFNPHHVREYTASEFESLMGEHYRVVQLYYQTAYSARYSSLLGSVGRSLPWLGFRTHQMRKLLGIPWENARRHYPKAAPADGTPEVLIAVCKA